MFDTNDLDSLIACDENPLAEYPPEDDDALATWRHDETYDPAWDMELPDSIRCEIESADRSTPG